MLRFLDVIPYPLLVDLFEMPQGFIRDSNEEENRARGASMNGELIARITRVFSDEQKQDVLLALLEVEESGDATAIEKVESEILFWRELIGVYDQGRCPNGCDASLEKVSDNGFDSWWRCPVCGCEVHR